MRSMRDPCCRGRRRASISARQSATSSAAEEESPAPRGTSPAISQMRAAEREPARGELGDDAAHERPPATARRRARASSELVALAEIARVGLDQLLGA